MCVSCMVTVRPERGRTCLESGAYLVNYKACHHCQHRTSLVTQEREEQQEEDDDGDYEQTITYSHVCGRCDHVIASHYYAFTVSHPALVADASLRPLPHLSTSATSSSRVQQEFLMDCALCGRAADTSHTINDVTHDRSSLIQSSLSLRPLQPTPVHLITATLLTVRTQPLPSIHSIRTTQVDVDDDEWD